MACSNSDSDNRFEDRLWKTEMTTSTIEKWPILRRLPQTLASRVRMAAVFGGGNSAIFFTSDGEAFGLGDNSFGRLGVGHENECLEPTKIEGLTNVKIKTMAFGFKHVAAVAESGSVLTWGHNECCHLENGTTDSSLVPQQVSGLNNHRVVDVACGDLHTLALTENGEVFVWGSNQYGELGLMFSTENPKKPMKLTEVIGSRRAVAIGCCEYSSFVVMDDGEVYACGHGKALGLGCDSDKLIPTRIETLKGVKIQRLACGWSHVLALADDQSIYVWGDNDCGQLGTGDTTEREVPVKIQTPGVRFVAVAAGLSVFNNLSMTLSVDGKCWVWGRCRSKSVLIPEPVGSASLHDAFAEFGRNKVTWKPFLVRQLPKNRAIDRINSAFDDPTTSDFKFLVDGKQIHVHRSLLKTQSEYFSSMFTGEWSESNKDEVEVEQWSYPVFYAFLKYLYTDGVVDLPIDQIIQLIDLANFYLESELEIRCHRLFRRNLTVENAALAYASACESNAKNVEEYCFQFINLPSTKGGDKVSTLRFIALFI